MAVTIDIYFDTRAFRKKTKDYPFKLRVHNNGSRKLYATVYGLAKADQEKLAAPRLGPILQKIKLDLKEIERTASDFIKKMDPFTFDEFERDFIRDNIFFEQARLKIITRSQPASDFDYTPFVKRFPILLETPDAGTIGEVFRLIIQKKLRRGKISTAVGYQCSYTSLVKYGGNVTFKAITDDFLYAYEAWMKDPASSNKVDGNSKTTIGMYTKNLRTVFNEADKLKVIKKERYYPFGNGRYVIPSSRNIKKALDLEDIREIYYYQCPPKLPQVNRSRAFWFFMYFGNGMNPKDLLLLKYKDITGKFLEFERAKTEETLREYPPKISVFLNEDMLRTIEEYGNTDRNPKNYIFPIFQLGMTPLRQYHVKEQFVKTVNKWMAFIINDLGIQRKGTTYVARHSYATVRSRAGASINEIQDELGQVNPKTTKRYIASLESQQKTSNASQLEAFKRFPKAEEIN